MRATPLLLATLLACCRRTDDTSPGKHTASMPVASTRVTTDPRLLQAISAAELGREPARIPRDALAASDAGVRRAAARALARSAAAKDSDALLELLADEDAPVASYAAFALGRACSARETEIVAALTLRAASWLTAGRDGSMPVAAFADALGRCGGNDAERTLTAWLSLEPTVANAAALGLGQLVNRRGGLGDASVVALIAAANAAPPLESALYPLTRVAPSSPTLREHAGSAAEKAIATKGLGRSFAVRALGRLEASEQLAPLLRRSDFSDLERAEIARELGQTPDGQAGLAAALVDWLPDDGAAQRLLDSESASLVAALEGLRSAELARPALLRLAALKLPEGNVHLRRRAVQLRCDAARLLAGSNIDDARLRECDPEARGRSAGLALVFVLDRDKLRGRRLQRYRELLQGGDPVVQQAALRLIPAHRELEEAAQLLTVALTASAPGVVAAAAETLATHPDRALGNVRAGVDAADTALTRALGAALRSERFATNPIVQAALIDAVSALGALDAMKELGAACSSRNDTVRAHAEKALRTLRKDATHCEPNAPPASFAELEGKQAAPSRLLFETDAGELSLELDASDAPLAVARVLALAQSGFYDGTQVHRAVPGFIVQFGDPGGDGYGGAPRPALPSELAPGPLEAGAVAMAAGGPDTASSQLFVALGRFPHLDGESTRIGHAGPGWERLLPGDRILRVRVAR